MPLEQTGDDEPNLGYAAVYPVALIAQILLALLRSSEARMIRGIMNRPMECPKRLGVLTSGRSANGGWTFAMLPSSLRSRHDSWSTP